jgi:putative PIN family toxin of toxin-antitoxin system
LRAVIDPNVLVSAWISPHGFPRRILDSADAGSFEMVVSQRLLAELASVLSRERLRRYGPIERAQAHVRRAMRVGVHVEIEGEPERVVPDDPKDDYLVALARVSGADYLVSGDPHLLEAALGESAVPVLTPRQFNELLESGDR